MKDFQETIENDVKNTLRESFHYGHESLTQFWKLNGEAICNDVYENLTDTVRDYEASYDKLIGDVHL